MQFSPRAWRWSSLNTLIYPHVLSPSDRAPLKSCSTSSQSLHPSISLVSKSNMVGSYTWKQVTKEANQAMALLSCTERGSLCLQTLHQALPKVPGSKQSPPGSTKIMKRGKEKINRDRCNSKLQQIHRVKPEREGPDFQVEIQHVFKN